MEISNNDTTFLIVAGSRELPLTIRLKLAPNIKNQLAENVNSAEYSIKIRMDNLLERTISLEHNEQILENIVQDLMLLKRVPATNFILHWADSDGIVISTPKQLRQIIDIVQSIFQFNALVSKMQNKYELSRAFNNALDNFVGLIC